MNFIIEFIKDIHPCYLILNILLWVVLFIYLEKQVKLKKYRMIFSIVYFIVSIFLFSYFNGLIQSIFDLKYLSVKSYLLMVVGVNLIILYTLNYPVRLGYKISNFILFIVIIIIFGSVVAIVLGNKYEQFYVMDIGNAIHFIDLSLVIFILYSIIISLVYIGYHLFDKKDMVLNEKISTKKSFSFPNFSYLKEKLKRDRNEKEEVYSYTDTEKNLITLEDLLEYNKGEGLYIHGVDCSIIFEDSNQENILKNYQILSKDIHARLMNGYTLDENKMLKNICMKLQVNNLASIDIGNVSLLNKISIDEYQLLRRVFGIN